VRMDPISIVKTIPNGVELHGWKVVSEKAPISNSSKLEEVRQELQVPNIPEMFFGQSRLSFIHESGDFVFSFNARDALAQWDFKTNSFQVACSKDWAERRQETLKDMTQLSYDWTYTTRYQGTIQVKSSNPEQS